MKKDWIKYLVIGACALLLSSGPICMAFVHSPVAVPGSLFWLLLPFTLMTLSEIVLTRRVLMPMLVERGRYVAFGVAMVGMSYAVNVGAVWVEYWLKRPLGLEEVLVSTPTVWVWVENVSASIAGAFLYTGMILWLLYDDHRLQSLQEAEIKLELEEKTRRFKERIRIREVAEMLEGIIGEVGRSAREANRQIRRLSDYLRDRLYDTEGRAEKIAPTEVSGWWEGNKAADFLLRSRYRVWRHLCLTGATGIMSAGLLFEYPGQLSITAYSVTSAIIFFVILTGVIYLNIYFLFPMLYRRGRVALYGWILSGIMGVLGLLAGIGGYPEGGIYNDYGLRVPDWVFVVALMGNLLVFFLIFAGAGSMVLIRKNLEGKWRISRLEMETARIEFEYLQSQVNPHFIFNVLNNAGILSYEDPEEAVATLQSLRGFLEYMLVDSRKRVTTLRDERKFILDYLTMELSSGEELAFMMEMGAEEEMRRIAPLVLIPFVENAVKHSAGGETEREVYIKIKGEERFILFECMNTIGRREKRGSGGLGIENTRRRLELLYGEYFRLEKKEEGNKYIVELKIPEER